MLGDHRSALDTLNRALALDPYAYVTHLSMGNTLEGQGELHAAAASYRSALSLAPPKAKVPASLHESMLHAVEVVNRDAERLQAFLKEAVAVERAAFPGSDLDRVDECLDIFSGLARRYVHETSLLYFPQLPALPFYDDAHFPWIPQLEQATDVIREELVVVMKEDWGAFHPYIQYGEGAPVRQWKELNHSPAWSAFDLWRDGQGAAAGIDRDGAGPGTQPERHVLRACPAHAHPPAHGFDERAPHRPPAPDPAAGVSLPGRQCPPKMDAQEGLGVR
jgi:hypothetical protein